tara:strand:- start:15 stop:317 length:303 start_codon:yes stop_codon:yes gene_type:complete
MAKKNEYQLIWESYEDSSMARMQGDEHNPPEYDFDDELDDRDIKIGNMMGQQRDLDNIARKYEGFSDKQLNAHIHVLEGLVDMGEQDRDRYFGGDLGSPF